MPDLRSRPIPTGTRRIRPAPAVRWMATFLGFPLGGLVARAVVGPVDDSTAALLGGMITGLFVGSAQAWGLALDRRAALRWVSATAVGLTIGLGLGATVVGYATTLPALVGQGAVCGLAVGAAQAGLLRTRLNRLAPAWPVTLAGIWALGWAVTTAAGVEVDERFTVFGSSGAIVVTALFGVLPLALHRSGTSAS